MADEKKELKQLLGKMEAALREREKELQALEK